MTEMASTVTALLPEDHLILGGRYLTSVGRALPGAAVRIVRPDGSLCDAGEEGEICVRGQGMMLGYYQMPEKTADVIRDGWYFTHDVGYLDEDGYLYLRGRKDSLIISGGENIYPEKSSDVLLKMPRSPKPPSTACPTEVGRAREGEHRLQARPVTDGRAGADILPRQHAVVPHAA